MEYRFVQGKQNYEDLSSGKVLYSAPGLTSFPVRLASELFQRCCRRLELSGEQGPYTLYDPCCGGGYLLTVIGLLHGDRLRGIYASDVSAAAVDIAEKNTGLLTPSGLEQRITQLENMSRLYGKPSHQEALISARRWRDQAASRPRDMDIHCFESDIAAPDRPPVVPERGIHIVMTDLPYGDLVDWQGGANAGQLLESIYPLLSRPSVVALVANKAQKLRHEKYRRVDYFKIGKRHAAILEPVEDEVSENMNNK